MWARVAEVILGGWLATSPLLLEHPGGDRMQWIADLGGGVLVILFAFLSWRRRLHRAHFCSIAVALWLMAIGFTGSSVPSPAAQNDIVVGLLLLTFVIVPSDASRPPAAWRSHPESQRADAAPSAYGPGRP
jgi:hypothetical protein